MMRPIAVIVSCGLLIAVGSLWATEVDEMRQRANVIAAEAAQLAQRGHLKEAEALERKAAHMREQAERAASGREDGNPQEEIAHRLEHMRAAVEHLHQAGIHDIANHVAERAEATQRELEGHKHHRGDDLMREVMNQIEQLRREMKSLRAEVKELRSNE